MCKHEHYRTRLIKITNQRHVINETNMYKERYCLDCGAVLSRTMCGEGGVEFSEFGKSVYAKHMKLNKGAKRPDFMAEAHNSCPEHRNRQHSGVGGHKPVYTTGYRLGYCV